MPSIVESLSKFLNLEKERGFKNTAIIGGLHKVVPYWENEARNMAIPADIIQSVTDLLEEYSSAEIGRRQDIIQELNIVMMGVPTPPPQENRPQQVKRPVPPVQTTPLPPKPVETRPDVPQRAQETVQPPTPAPYSPPKPPQAPAVLVKKETPTPRRATPGSRLPDSVTPVTLNAPLTVINGIGDETSKKLRNLNLYTLKDLLYNFPRDYHDFSQAKTINRIMFGDQLTVIGTIQSIHARDARSGKVSIIEAVIGDTTGNLRITWFNRRFLLNQYHPGDQVSVSGVIKQYLGRLMMDSPEIEPLEADNLSTNRISPVYPLTAGITQKFMRRIMKQTVDFNARRVADYLPEPVRLDANLAPLWNALLQVHFPDTQEDLDDARRRIAFDEIFLLQMGVLR
ncbi:MAG: hypothetical protein WCG34_06685, partial [Leptolinea sp.]